MTTVEWQQKAGAMVAHPPARPTLDWSADMGDVTCSVDGCDRADRIVHGWCPMHYKRWKRHGDTESLRPRDRICSIDGCDSPHLARGWCHLHYYRWRSSFPTSPITGDDLDRFWLFVDKAGPAPEADTLAAGKGPCWLWTRGVKRDGYGQLSVQSTTVSAHRFSYQMLVGPIGDGLELDHLCTRPWCVNPAHLEPVTHAENIRRRTELKRRRLAGV